MRLHIASDLHFEYLHRVFPNHLRLGRAAPPHTDVLVLAGDIHNGLGAVELFKDWACPVIYVLGNHEFYGAAIEPTVEAIRRAAQGTSVHLLDCDALVLDGVRFLGCTLWTDYCLNGEGAAQANAMKSCESVLADHHKIRGHRRVGEGFGAREALAIHQHQRDWLAEQLAQPHNGKTVVVTHHGPHPGSIHKRFRDNPCNPGFISRLEPLVEQADLWIHGHVHDSFDYPVGPRGRVVTNPGGYAAGLQSAVSLSQLRWENPAFDPFKIVDLNDAQGWQAKPHAQPPKTRFWSRW